MHTYLVAAVKLSLCVVLAVPAAAQAPDDHAGTARPQRYPNITSAEQTIEFWTPDQHLYVKGDLGIANRQLESLEDWLDDNAPHWTVVLMSDAEDEVYRSLDRRTYRSLDAVEYALGRGLALRTSFSELVDPRTGETDGAVFVLFLRERKFSYYASVAQDSRNLGESHWLGELDQPAFRAMRGGGRILDAVRETITNISSRLTQKIEAEQQQAERIARAKRRAVAHLTADIALVREQIDRVEQSATRLTKKTPTATGELAQPPTTDWRRQLDNITDMLTAGNASQLASRANEISDHVEGFLNAHSTYETFDEAVAPIQKGIDDLLTQEIAAGRGRAEEAMQKIAAARSAMAKGERGVAELIAAAASAVAAGRQAVDEETRRLERAEARRRLIGKTVIATVALILLAIVCLLFWLNRRRLPTKKQAKQRLKSREVEVTQRMEAVYGLFERCREVLGDQKRVEQRGYEGTTLQLTNDAFDDVDDLFVMSSEVERVMAEARELILPQSLVGRVANLFTDSRYERGINRITGEPLTFHRDKGLPLVIERDSERTGEEPPEQVTMTFDTVFSAFQQRTTTAQETLNTIERSLGEVDQRLDDLQQQIASAAALNDELTALATDDGFFELPSFFDHLIPSVQADFDQADKIAALDPVQAMQDPIPRALRKLRDAKSVTRAVQQARSDLFPSLNDHAPQLQELGYETDWIQERVRNLDEQANDLLELATSRDIAEEGIALAGSMDALKTRVRVCSEIAHSLEVDAEPSLDELQQSVIETRARIAETLNLPAEKCLAEYGSNPDRHLSSARQLIEAIRAALRRGEDDAAEHATEQLNTETTTALALIDRSLRVLHEFDGNQNDRNTHLERLADKLPDHRQMLDGISDRFAESALLLQSADALHEGSSATVGSLLEECDAAIHAARTTIQEAAQSFRSGCLISAEAFLEQARALTVEAESNLAEAAEHCSKVEQVSRENSAELDGAERAADSLRHLVDDPRTMRPTIEDHNRIVADLQSTKRKLATELPRDPFRDASRIASFADQIDSLEALIGADHDAHEEAARAVRGARQERANAEQLINRAHQDGIPDSAATTATIQEVRSLDIELSAVEQELGGHHNDWQRVDQSAARIQSQLSVKAAELKGELDRASRTAALFESASDAVFEATRWTGGFGTRIPGSPGSNELERARRALNQGDYSAMADLARIAQMAAQQAIQRAQREVQRKQREAARRAEAARRKRRNRSINSGGGFSFPSSRRSSSSHSSSRSPSGSGFSRSGW